MLTYEGPHLICVSNTDGTPDLHESHAFHQFVARVLTQGYSSHDPEPHPCGKAFIAWVEGRFKTTIADVAKAVTFLYGCDGKRRFFRFVGLADNFLAN